MDEQSNRLFPYLLQHLLSSVYFALMSLKSLMNRQSMVVHAVVFCWLSDLKIWTWSNQVKVGLDLAEAGTDLAETGTLELVGRGTHWVGTGEAEKHQVATHQQLQQEELGQVVSSGIVQAVLEHLHLVHQGQVVVVRGHPQDDPVLDVEQDLLLLPVVPDKGMESVGLRHPANQAGVGGERNHEESLNSQVPFQSLGVAGEEGVDQREELHHPLVLSEVLVPLQEEHVLLPVAPSHALLPRPLLAGDHLKAGVDAGDPDDVLVGEVGPGHGQLQVAAHQQLGGDVVVEVPGLVEVPDVVGHFVSLAPLLGLRQVVAVGLTEARLLQGLRPLVHHGVQRLQRGEHSRHVPLPEEEPTGLLEALVPLLVPEDGHPDELLAHYDGLVHQGLAVLLQFVEDLPGRRAGLAGHGERVDEGLGELQAPDGLDEAEKHRAEAQLGHGKHWVLSA